jgi:ABC-type transport system involved in multi-copper enzyme maturation permease subunit
MLSMLHHPVLALFTRSLLTEGRSLRRYGGRLIWLVGTLLMIYPATQDFQLAAPGLMVFRNLMMLNLVLICLVGTPLFANAISEEKEEQMLGLLCMTALSPVAILLGKSSARMIAMGLLLLAQLPFALLTITLGGIALPQILAAYVALLGLIVLMANLALLWSVIARDGNSAMSFTVLTMTLLFALPPVIVGLGRNAFSQDAVLDVLLVMAEPLLLISPFVRVMEVLTAFDGRIVHSQVLANFAIAGLCFFLAGRVFERFAWPEPQGKGGQSAPSAGPQHHTRLFPAWRAWRFPLAWKAFFFESHGVAGWIARVSIAVVFLAFATDTFEQTNDVGGMLLYLGVAGCLVEGLGIASNIFRAEQEEKTWSTLCALPLGLGQIVLQKTLGALVGVVPWVLCAVAGAVLLGSRNLWAFVSHIIRHPEGLLIFSLMYTALLLLVIWISLWEKRGAGLIAIAVFFFGNALGGGMLPCLMICVLGPFAIAHRLRGIASS